MVCLPLSTHNADFCESEMCIEEVQELTVNDQTVTCACSDVPAAELATDQQASYFSIQYRRFTSQTDNLSVSLLFDNRASVGLSAATLNKYAAYATVKYETIQGEMNVHNAPFEVLEFTSGSPGRLRARVEGVVDQVLNVAPDLGGIGICSWYSAMSTAELNIDIDVPLEVKPWPVATPAGP